MPSSSSVRVNAGSSIGLNFAHEESYQHDPLDTTKQQIRLLKVIRDNDGPIRCVISTSDIDTAPEYRALSYTWGSREPGFYVLVQGKRLEIRPNLAKFLQNIRREKEEYLWIDQICIDQSNTIERNHQVGLMSQIYSQCTSVVVWLSDSLGLCAEAGRQFSTFEDEHSLATVLRNAYFNRLWVIQEVILAPHRKVLIDGNTWLSWDTMREIVGDEDDASDFFSEVRPLFQPRISKDFCSTMEEFSNYDCENPRDKVYGLMGLVDEAQRVQIDYSKTSFEVYIDAVVAVNSLPSSPYGYYDSLPQLAFNMRICTEDRKSFMEFLDVVLPRSSVFPKLAQSWISSIILDTRDIASKKRFRTGSTSSRTVGEKLSVGHGEQSGQHPESGTILRWDLIGLITEEGFSCDVDGLSDFRKTVAEIGYTGIWYYVTNGEVHDCSPDWESFFRLPRTMMREILRGKSKERDMAEEWARGRAKQPSVRRRPRMFPANICVQQGLLWTAFEVPETSSTIADESN